MRRAVSIAGWALVWSGLIILGVAGYQLFFTDLLNARAQAQARQDLEVVLAERRDELAPAGEAPGSAPSTLPTVPAATLEVEEAGEEGEPLAAMRVPALGLDEVIFEGVGVDTLKSGPGHMPWTPVPGQPGNAVVSGHRTTYGRPFFDLDLLQPGDRIEVDTAVGTHTFTVRETLLVAPEDVWVTEPRPGAWLTLTTCHPKYSARQRLIVFAELTAGPNLEYVQQLTAPGRPA